ncbi:MAG: hypothetical protein Q4F99_00420 [bacterium]|nr:hypothetical protein [bacterium]
MSKKEPFNPFIRLDGCDPQALVEISSQFTTLNLDFAQPTPPMTEAKHAQVSDRSDWNAVANALGNIYQALCNNECNAALNAMRSIERILTKRGIAVPQPSITMRPPTVEEELPIETEFDYGE